MILDQHEDALRGQALHQGVEDGRVGAWRRGHPDRIDAGKRIQDRRRFHLAGEHVDAARDEGVAGRVDDLTVGDRELASAAHGRALASICVKSPALR